MRWYRFLLFDVGGQEEAENSINDVSVKYKNAAVYGRTLWRR